MAEARKLREIETCPNGHRYNATKYGDICAVCKAKLNPPAPEELTEAEIEEQTYVKEKDRVCGWLVCILGENQGRDYKIRDGKNFIGSDSDMDIQIIGDRRIEKRNHAVIMYDAKSRASLLLPGDSHGMVYWEDTAIFEPKPLEPFNRIELGESVFLFIALCGGDFDWDDLKDEQQKRNGAK